jgi:hypothetical protein
LLDLEVEIILFNTLDISSSLFIINLQFGKSLEKSQSISQYCVSSLSFAAIFIL